MKNVITFLMCLLCIFTGIAQTDLTGNSMVIPDRTPELEALYQQAKVLEENGTAAEINANRIAIKNAWQSIDPAIAALYRPIATNLSPEVDFSGQSNSPTQRDEENYIPEDWGTDRLLMSEFVDGGVDMDVTASGDIYISAYQNDIDNGGTFDELIIHRSTDGGNNFTEWQRINVTAPMRKLQIISMDGTGDNYLLAYLTTETKNFQVFRWNMASGDFQAEVIASDVTDFGVDRNYPAGTSTQRVFATYHKSDNSTYSARSTAGSYGFGWVDETSIGIVGEQVDFTYGINGACYTTFVGFNSRSLRANVNSNYNDPASWGSNETITDGAVTEVINPTIRAARLTIASDKVVIWASQRPDGSTNGYSGLGLKRENGGAYASFSNFGSGGADWSIAQTDSWVRKINNTDEIRLSYVRDNVPNAEDDLNRSITFNGAGFDTFEPVGDIGINVWDGFPSATAETSDTLPCLAFAGTSAGGTFGFGLYFDAKTVLGVEDNSFEDFTYYPNPINDVLNLSTKSIIENVSIFSTLGQKMMETSVAQNKTSLNLTSLTPGVYFMKVKIDGNFATYKIVKH